MSRTREQRVDDLFQSALDLPPNERGAFIARAGNDDDSIAAEVSALLQTAESLAAVDDLPLSAARERLLTEVFTSDDDIEDLSGQTIGHWQIRRRIARGGLATVYIADRSDGEFHQQAAFKVLRRGLDTDDLIARFRAEREILSSLDHPSIAGILDGGALPDGRPFLVVEYVEGMAITEYCKTRTVSADGKVRLMIDVLRALHHAHSHLVVHRDVKPSNILVSEEGRVVLLDFGIAKILDPSAMPGASTATRTGVSLLTPGYGSPEQHAGTKITTASDIYQCGIVLYELLTGERASSRDTRSHLPSTGFTDLDAIIGKATAGDPGQRYSSADEMRTDLRRFLDRQPVSARPPTIAYRVGKLARRRPWLFPAAALALFAAVAYVVTITVYSKRLAEQQQLATASQQFLVDLFRSPDPFNPASLAAGRDITVLEALDVGRGRVGSELAGNPKLQASLYGSIADVYSNLDRDNDAIELLETAVALEREAYGDDSPQVATTLRNLVPLLRRSGENERASEYSDRQLALARNIFAEDSAELGLAHITAGIDRYNAGEVHNGRALLASGIDLLRPHRQRYPNELINALIIYAQNLGVEFESDAFNAISEADNIAMTSFGNDSLQRASAKIRMASTLTLVGKFESSERNFNEALPVLEQHLGRDHSATVSALSNFAFMMARRGDLDQAETLFLDLVERQRNLFGEDSRAVADSSQNLGAIYTRMGRYADAVAPVETAYQIYSSILNEDNYVIGFPLLTLAYSHIELDRPDEAEPYAREALRIFEKSLPDTHLHGVAQCLTGVSLEYQGQAAAGARIVEASHPLLGKGDIGDHYRLLCRFPP